MAVSGPLKTVPVPDIQRLMKKGISFWITAILSNEMDASCVCAKSEKPAYALKKNQMRVENCM